MSNCPIRSDKKTAEWYEQEIRKLDPAILELKLARPALRALVNASLYTMEKLRTRSLPELSKLHGMGPAALRKLQALVKKDKP